MKILPRARQNNVVVQALDREILLYDLNVHRAFHLNETASAVYQACNGETTFDELKLRHKFTDDVILLALDRLRADDLIVKEDVPAPLFGSVSRREVIRRAGLASLVALPVISALAAPTAAHAQSLLIDVICETPGGDVCRTSADCLATSYCGTELVQRCSCVVNCCVECPGTDGVLCGGVCADVSTDVLNCGACGNQCLIDEFCIGGACLIPAR